MNVHDCVEVAAVLKLLEDLRERGVTSFEGCGIKVALSPPPPKPLDPERPLSASEVKQLERASESVDDKLFKHLPGFVRRDAPKAPRPRPPARKAVTT